MNRSDLIECVASNAGLTKAEAKRAIDSYHDCVRGALKKGNKVAITGFGSYSVETRSARMVRNPRTGEKLKIDSKKYIKFRPGSGMTFKK
jgi:DNA-binding protein HU-beta